MRLNFSGIVCVSPEVKKNLPNKMHQVKRNLHGEALRKEGQAVLLNEAIANEAANGFILDTKNKTLLIGGRPVGRMYLFNDAEYADRAAYSAWLSSHEGQYDEKVTSFVNDVILSGREFNKPGSMLFYLG